MPSRRLPENDNGGCLRNRIKKGDLKKGGISNVKPYLKNSFLRCLLGGLLLGATMFSLVACTKTINVYHPPRLDLTQFGRLGMITFSDNAQPSVADYATQQFQNQIHSAQAGIPIVQLGTEEAVLKSIGASRMDPDAMAKIGERYKVSAVFKGDVVYSDVETNVNLQDVLDLKASAETTLNATLSAELIETEGGATVWSDSTSWKRKLGNVNVNGVSGISVGTEEVGS